MFTLGHSPSISPHLSATILVTENAFTAGAITVFTPLVLQQHNEADYFHPHFEGGSGSREVHCSGPTHTRS